MSPRSSLAAIGCTVGEPVIDRVPASREWGAMPHSTSGHGEVGGVGNQGGGKLNLPLRPHLEHDAARFPPRSLGLLDGRKQERKRRNEQCNFFFSLHVTVGAPSALTTVFQGEYLLPLKQEWRDGGRERGKGGKGDDMFGHDGGSR